MTGLDFLEQKFKEHEAQYVTALARGDCKDFGEYQRVCGVIHGLTLAIAELNDLRQRMESYEDE